METALERNNPRVARKTIRIPQLERLKSNRNEKILIHRQVSRLSSKNIDAVLKINVGSYFDELVLLSIAVAFVVSLLLLRH